MLELLSLFTLEVKHSHYVTMAQKARNRGSSKDSGKTMVENGEAVGREEEGRRLSSTSTTSATSKKSLVKKEAREAKLFLRGFFFLSGVLLSGSLYLEDQKGRNYCLWFTLHSINAFAAFFAAVQPKILGKQP